MQEQEEAFSRKSSCNASSPATWLTAQLNPGHRSMVGRGCSLGWDNPDGKSTILGILRIKIPMFFTKYYLEKYSCLRLCSGWHLICMSVQTGRCPGLCIIYSLWGATGLTHQHTPSSDGEGDDSPRTWTHTVPEAWESPMSRCLKYSMTSLGTNHPAINPHVWSHGSLIWLRATWTSRKQGHIWAKNRPGQQAWSETVLVKWFCIVTRP